MSQRDKDQFHSGVSPRTAALTALMDLQLSEADLELAASWCGTGEFEFGEEHPLPQFSLQIF